jgi:acylphosphatase
MTIKRLAITVTGRVQGVGFRFYTEDVANNFELSGWVRNNPDRTVECEVQGEEAVLEEFCRELKKGPPLSKVKNLLTTEVPVVEGSASGFEISY